MNNSRIRMDFSTFCSLAIFKFACTQIEKCVDGYIYAKKNKKRLMSFFVNNKLL